MSRTMSELQIWYGSQSGGTKRRNRVMERWRFTFDFGKGAKKSPSGTVPYCGLRDAAETGLTAPLTN